MTKKRIVLTLALCLCVLLPAASFAAIPSSPMASFYVNDYADVIDDSDENEMIALGAALEDASGAQVVAVTVNFLDGLDIEEYGTRLFNQWGIGQAGESNGVLILLSIGDREIWTVPGSGLEDKMTASVINSYHDDYAIPYFSDDDFSRGMLEDYRAHCDKVASIYGVNLNNTNSGGRSNTGSGYNYDYSYDYSYDEEKGGIGVMGFIFAIVILLIVLSIVRSALRGVGRVARPRRSWWFGNWGGWHGWYRPHRHPRGHMPPPPHGRKPGGFGSSPTRPPSASPPSSGPRTGGGGTSRGGGAGRSFGGSSSGRSFGGGSSSGRSFGGGSKPSGRSGGGGSSRGGGGGRKF